MINIIKQPDDYCLAGNPVIFAMESDSLDLITISVIVAGETHEFTRHPYGKSAPYFADIDISGILLSFFTETSITDNNPIIVKLDNFVLDYTVIIEDQSFNKHAINGGISDHLSESLSDYGMSASDYIFNNYEKQFLFTTRTNSSSLTLKETEIFPFVFLHPGKVISFTTINDRSIAIPALAKGQACLMDINTLRKTFFELYNESPSYFKVYIENSYTFDITILPNVISENRLLIRFKNSVGGFEQIEVTGDANFTPEISEEEPYQILNSRKLYEKRRRRPSITNIISANSGFKSKADLLFMLDMLCSDRTYIIYPDQTIRRCNVSADNDISIPFVMTTPQSIELKIEMVNDDLFYSPEINFTRPGAWILETGFWNDFASWKDNRFWIDKLN